MADWYADSIDLARQRNKSRFAGPIDLGRVWAKSPFAKTKTSSASRRRTTVLSGRLFMEYFPFAPNIRIEFTTTAWAAESLWEVFAAGSDSVVPVTQHPLHR